MRLILIDFKIIYFNVKNIIMIELIVSFSLNSQAPCSSFTHPSLGNLDAM